MHKDFSKKAIKILKEFDEVSKIVFYGSVYRNEHKKDSDIDLAFICDDVMKSFPLNPDGTLVGLKEKIDRSLYPLEKTSGLKFHVPLYWNSELEEGIMFPSKNNFPDNLLDAGEIVFDAYK